MENFDFKDFDLLTREAQIEKLLGYFCEKAINQRNEETARQQENETKRIKSEEQKDLLISKAKKLGFKVDGSKKDFKKLGVGEAELERLDKYLDPIERFLYLFGLYVS